MNASSRLLLLLLSAAAGAACGGSTTSDPDETSAGGAAGSGQAGSGQAGSGQSGAGQGGAGGVKNKCAGPCVPTEWCQDGATTCQCKSDAYLCPVPLPLDPGNQVLVCYPKGQDECLATTSPELQAKLTEKFPYSTQACASFVEAQKTLTASDGSTSCCYVVAAGPCVGRPLATADGLRLAGLADDAAWT